MQKFLITSLTILILAGCSQGLKTSDENPMIGNWICTTNYYNFLGNGIGVRTEDIIQYEKDGLYHTNGVISLPITAGKPMFVDHQESFGKWEFRDHELKLTPANVETVAAHSAETAKKLKKDRKLNQIEKALSNQFTSNVGTMTFKIIKNEGDVIIQEQKLGKDSYFPICMKPETLQKKIKSGEIKLNPNY